MEYFVTSPLALCHSVECFMTASWIWGRAWSTLWPALGSVTRLFDGKTLQRKFPRLFDESRRTIRRYTIRRRDYSTVYYSTERLFDGKTIRRKDHSTEICLICLHTAMGQINVLSICIHDCIQVWKYLLFVSLQDVQKKLKDLRKSSDNSVVFQVWCK